MNIQSTALELLDIFLTRKTTHSSLYFTNFNNNIERTSEPKARVAFSAKSVNFSQLKHVIVCLIIILIQACTTTSNQDAWPTDLPERGIFVEYCQNNSKSCSSRDKTEEYLVWVKRFYYGSIIYPTGWNEISQLLNSSLDKTQDQTNFNERLDKLGLTIVFEWAKENSERLIDSQLLAIWGRALRSSAERNEQIDFISRIENDVNGILSGSIEPEKITFERYYPTEDYDNF